MAGIYAADGSQNVTVVGGTSPTPPTGTSATEIQGTAAGNAAAVGDPVQTGGIYESTPSTYDNGDAVPLHTDSRGNLKTTLLSADGITAVNVSSPTSDGAAAASGLAVREFGLMFNGSTWDRDRKPPSVAKLASSAASTNATVVKASAGDVFAVYGYNANAALRYLKLYNKATAPTVGTDVPVITFPLPPTSAFRFEIAKGLYFGTGIGYALTTGATDGDTGAVGAVDIIAQNIVYA